MQCNQNQPEPLADTKPSKHTRESPLKGAEPLIELPKRNSEPINATKSTRNDIKPISCMKPLTNDSESENNFEPSLMTTEPMIFNIESQINGIKPSINGNESLTNNMEESKNNLELSIKSEQLKCNVESTKNATYSLLSSLNPLTNNMEPQITNFIMRTGNKIPTVEKTIVERKRKCTIRVPAMTR